MHVWCSVAGGLDQSLNEIKDLYEFVGFMGEVIKEPKKTISGIYNAFINLTLDQVKKMAQKALQQKLDNYTHTGNEKFYYLTRDAIAAVAAIYGGYKIGKKLYKKWSDAYKNKKRIRDFVDKFDGETGEKIRNLSDELKTKFIDDFEGLDADAVRLFNENSGMVDAWEAINDLPDHIRKNTVVLGKVDFLKDKGLSNAQVKTIAALDDIKTLELAESLAKRSEFSIAHTKVKDGTSYFMKDNLHNVAIYAKKIETNWPNIPNVIQDFIDLVNNNQFKNPHQFEDWLKGARGNDGPTYKLELEDAKKVIADGDEVELGHQPGVNSDGTVVDVDVYNVSKNIAIECKNPELFKNFRKNVGLIGEKFNKESKLPEIIRSSFDKLEGSIHVSDELSFLNFSNPGGFNNRDKILWEILKFVDTGGSVKVEGFNQLSKLHVKIGNNIEYTFLKSEWKN